MQRISFHRENVSIMREGLQPRVYVENHADAIPADGVLIRNLFSLTGTVRERSLLRFLPDFLGLPLHPGYASVGVVTEVGSACRTLDRGDIVLMPVCRSTYVTFSQAYPHPSSEPLLRKVPLQVDGVDATFVPLVSLSLYLARQAIGTVDKPVILLGCGLLGIVLLRVLTLENINAIVYTCEEDIPEEWIRENTIEVVLSCDQPLPLKFRGKVQTAFILSSSKSYYEAASLLLSTRGNCIPAAAADSKQVSVPHFPWLGNDIIEDAVDLLRDGDLLVKDLIAQHVHPEAVAQVYHAIQQNHYSGRALVYDW